MVKVVFSVVEAEALNDLYLLNISIIIYHSESFASLLS